MAVHQLERQRRTELECGPSSSNLWRVVCRCPRHNGRDNRQRPRRQRLPIRLDHKHLAIQLEDDRRLQGVLCHLHQQWLDWPDESGIPNSVEVILRDDAKTRGAGSHTGPGPCTYGGVTIRQRCGQKQSIGRFLNEDWTAIHIRFPTNQSCCVVAATEYRDEMLRRLGPENPSDLQMFPFTFWMPGGVY